MGRSACLASVWMKACLRGSSQYPGKGKADLQMNLMNFNKDKCQVQCLGCNNSMQQDRQAANWLESSLAEKDLEILVESTLSASQEHAVLEMMTKSILGCSSKCVARRARGVIIPLYCRRVRPHLEAVSSFGLPEKRYWHTHASPVEATKKIRGLEHMTYGDRLQEWCLFSLGKRRLKGERYVIAVFNSCGKIWGRQPPTLLGGVWSLAKRQQEIVAMQEMLTRN